MSKTNIGVIYMCVYILLFSVAIAGYFSKKQEHFQSFLETPTLVYKVDTSLEPLYVYSPYPEVDMQRYWQKITSIDVTYSKEQEGQAHIHVCDVFDIGRKPVVSVIPDSYKVVAVFKNRYGRSARFKDIQQLSSIQKPTIGIFDTKAKEFAQFFGSVTNTSPTIRKLKQSLDASEKTDIYVMYDTPKSIQDFIKTNDDRMEFLRVDTIDIHTLKATWEYARYESIDISTQFIKQVEPFSIMKFIVFDVFLVQMKIIAKEYVPQIHQLLANFGEKAFAMNNYYTLFFTYSSFVHTYMTLKNDHIQKRSTGRKLQILEEFIDTKNASFIYDMEREIPGFFDSSSFKFYMTDIQSLYVPPKIGMKLRLTKQPINIQNGVYHITQVDDTQAVLQKEHHLQTGQQKDERLDGRYKCYGDPYVMNEGLCNSLLDEAGQPKVARTYWDRPCEVNEECPFYQKNKNYKNYRGGCNGGFCELPIGVERLSWRLYDKNTKPVCHGCPKTNVRCCDQKNTDYAFELDYYERKASLEGK